MGVGFTVRAACGQVLERRPHQRLLNRMHELDIEPWAEEPVAAFQRTPQNFSRLSVLLLEPLPHTHLFKIVRPQRVAQPQCHDVGLRQRHLKRSRGFAEDRLRARFLEDLDLERQRVGHPAG
jgi:hypothetical protein